MSKNFFRMTGLLMMMVSVFFIVGGLFLKGDGIPPAVPAVSLGAGLLMLVIGTVFYKILKNE